MGSSCAPKLMTTLTALGLGLSAAGPGRIEENASSSFSTRGTKITDCLLFVFFVVSVFTSHKLIT